LHSDTIQRLCSSADVVNVVMEARWAGHAEMKYTQRTAVLFCKPKGKKDICGSLRIIF